MTRVLVVVVGVVLVVKMYRGNVGCNPIAILVRARR